MEKWNRGGCGCRNNGRYQPTEGYTTVTSPGNDPYVLTVGAMKPMGTPTRTDDLIASYSSKGPTVVDAVVKPDLVAPGNLLISLAAPSSSLYTQNPGNQVPYTYYVNGGSSSPSSAYFTLSGTSMATGVVSGVVADLLQQKSAPYSRSGQGPANADGIQDLPAIQQARPIPPPASPTPISTTSSPSAPVYVDVEAALNSSVVAKGTACLPSRRSIPIPMK